MRFAASLVGRDRAADIVSDVMVSTLQQRALTSLENPKAYLMQSVLNRARSAGRTQSREHRALSRVPADTDNADPADYTLNNDIAEAVGRLPVQQRAAIYLVFWEDLDPKEAAQVMGVGAGTVRRYLFLARNKLRSWIDE